MGYGIHESRHDVAAQVAGVATTARPALSRAQRGHSRLHDRREPAADQPAPAQVRARSHPLHGLSQRRGVLRDSADGRRRPELLSAPGRIHCVELVRAYVDALGARRRGVDSLRLGARPRQPGQDDPRGRPTPDTPRRADAARSHRDAESAHRAPRDAAHVDRPAHRLRAESEVRAARRGAQERERRGARRRDSFLAGPHHLSPRQGAHARRRSLHGHGQSPPGRAARAQVSAALGKN